MNKKGFVDLEELNILAVLFAFAAAIVSLGVLKYAGTADVPVQLWVKVAAPILTFIITYIFLAWRLD